MATYRVIGKGEYNKYCDDDARRDVIDYCLKKSKIPHAYIGARAVNINNAAFEMTALAKVYDKDERVRLRHSIISFDKSEHITASQAAEIADKAIRFFGDRHQIIYAVHEDAEHVHIHMVMNQVSFRDGKKYHGTKKDHYDFVKYMKNEVRPYGINFIPVSDG